MTLEPTEWLRAQSLLVKLVKTFVPVDKKTEEQEKIGSSLILNSSLFLPPSGFSFRQHHFELLTEISTWIGQTFPESAEKPTQEKQGIFQKADEKMSSSPTKNNTKSSNEISASKPQSIQEQRLLLVHQVRQAIGKLCTSTNVADPNGEILKEALHRLKPLIDQIIHSIPAEEIFSSEQTVRTPNRWPIPLSPREHLIKKWVESESEKGKKSAALQNAADQKANASHSKPLRHVNAKKEGENTADSKPQSSPNQQSNPLPDRIAAVFLGDKSLIKQDKEQLRSIERIVLPGAPYLSQVRSLTPPRKKKKRKGFWFKDKEEDETNR